MVAKVRVQKRLYYKIGEACKVLGIQPYVLRYWETEFPALAPSKSRSGQRVYSEKELEIIRRIKGLLYEEGYTIAGAKKKLESELANGTLGEPEGQAPIASVAAGEPEEAPEHAGVEAPSPQASARGVSRARSSAPPVLDSDSAEQIESLRSGIEKALHEAREILALLETKSS